MSLVRKVKNGKKYNALIPYSSCDRVSFGKGDTFYSVEKIATQALQHSNQVEKLAKVLKKEANNGTLQEIANTIHSFLYWHLQYQADGEAQLLRSPACAWQQRYDGVDCKSYSIFASAILLQLGIKHYIRQIKQPNLSPNDYTHVYVVVPKNQSSGSLKDGYYTIDGTLQHTNEPNYLVKNDTFMDLQHYGLNGLAEAKGDSWLNDLFKNFNFSNLFGSISCWGGTAFDADKVKALVPAITDYFLAIIDQYNLAIQEGRFEDVHKIYVTYWQRKHTLLKTYHVKYSSKDWNSCSDASFLFIFDFLNYKIGDVLGKAFEKHIITYFTLDKKRNNTINWAKTAETGDTFDGVYMWGTSVGRNVSDMTWRDWDKTPKPHTYTTGVTPKTTEIPAFVVTPEIENALNTSVQSGTINLDSFLQSLIATAPVIFDSTSATDEYNNQNPNNPYQNIEPTTQKAGFGTVGGVLLAGVAAKLAWDYYKNKKQK